MSARGFLLAAGVWAMGAVLGWCVVAVLLPVWFGR